MNSAEYWAERQVRAQDRLQKKTEKEIQKQLNKYYVQCMKQVLADFEATYNKLLVTVKDGKEPTVADLYSLDKYWQMQIRLTQLCQELGNKEVALLSKKFMEQYEEAYLDASLPSSKEFTEVSTSQAEQMIKNNWAGDGKDFSQRIWNNTNALVQTLNEQLISCVTTGRSTADLRKKLIERFNVSRSAANRVIRTETCRIQTEAAAKRYEDDGIERYRIRGREEGKCGHKPDCHDMDGEIFYLSEKKVGVNCPPFHPNCRCRIMPVVSNELLRKRQEEIREKEKARRAAEAIEKAEREAAKKNKKK